MLSGSLDGRGVWSWMNTCMCELKSLSHVLLFVTPWTVACQAPLSMGILQAGILEWVAVPFSRGSFQPGIKPRFPTLQVSSLPSEPPGKPNTCMCMALCLHCSPKSITTLLINYISIKKILSIFNKIKRAILKELLLSSSSCCWLIVEVLPYTSYGYLYPTCGIVLLRSMHLERKGNIINNSKSVCVWCGVVCITALTEPGRNSLIDEKRKYLSLLYLAVEGQASWK